MKKKDRIAIVVSILYLMLPLSIVGGGGEGPEAALLMLSVLIAYWGYRFIKGDISFIKSKEVDET